MDLTTPDELIPSIIPSESKEHSFLSNTGILRHIERGNIRIHPFNKEQLKTGSYDVRLGAYFFRENKNSRNSTPWKTSSYGIFNPYSESSVRQIWGEPLIAEQLVTLRRKDKSIPVLENIDDTERVIFIEPGEIILAHTEEFIGGLNNITTMMKTRSSMGRSFIESCKCAGAGDVGFTNRWAMEITNNSQNQVIPLVVGRRIAQILFFEVEKPTDNSTYEKSGKYQTESDFNKVIATWTPELLLPKLYMDYELKDKIVTSLHYL